MEETLATLPRLYRGILLFWPGFFALLGQRGLLIAQVGNSSALHLCPILGEAFYIDCLVEAVQPAFSSLPLPKR